MARRKRSHFQGAIHLVTVHGHARRHIFYEPTVFTQAPENPRRHAPDAVYFEDLLWETCEQYGARAHAYVIEANRSLFVIQTDAAPLCWIAHDLLARFSTYLIRHNRIPRGERPFPRRYRAQVVQPEKLPYVVRFVQRREVPASRRRRPINHPFSSSLIYSGRRPKPACFTVGLTQQAIERLGYLGPNAFYQFMASKDSPAIALLLSRHIVGEPAFAESIPQRCQQLPTVPSADEILREVTGSLLHIERSVACSPTRVGALARALVAWYAMRTGAAQIGSVANWFGVTSSDLRYLICRHRTKSPQYFVRSISSLFPVLAARPNSSLDSGDSIGLMAAGRRQPYHASTRRNESQVVQPP